MISWSRSSFINEFTSWKNGNSEDSLINTDGSRGLQWRHEIPHDVFECASADAAKSLRSFHASRNGKRRGPAVGFPRFQAKGKVASSFRLRNHPTLGQASSSQRIRFCDSRHLRLSKLGTMKVCGPTLKVRRMIDDGRFIIYSATLKERAGRWTVCLSGVAKELHQAKRSRTSRHTVPIGIDRGIISLCVAADANGTQFENFEGVKKLREAQCALKRANKALARTKPRSKGRQRARARLASTHLKVANTRKHLVHQASKTLVSKYQILVLEDLNIPGMMKNRHLARSISDAAMGELSRQIRYKAKWHGVEVRQADRFFPSSKSCSACGNVKSELKLSERTFLCDLCHLSIDRDVNAAVNLARWSAPVSALRLESSSASPLSTI